MLHAFRLTASTMAAPASMCSLACDSVLAGCSGLQARRFTHIISLRNFKRPAHSRSAAAHPLQQQPPPAHGQLKPCQRPMRHSSFAASAVPQMAPEVGSIDTAPGSIQFRRKQPASHPQHNDGSAATAVAERLEQVAAAQSARSSDSAVGLERQPPRRQQSPPPGGSRSKRPEKQQRQKAPDQPPWLTARQKPPPALKPGSDPHAIRSPSLVRNSDIPSHAWTAMRKLKDAGVVRFGLALKMVPCSVWTSCAVFEPALRCFLQIGRALRFAGYEVFLVGGAVRDALVGGTPKDFDILTSARTSQVSLHLTFAESLCAGSQSNFAAAVWQMLDIKLALVTPLQVRSLFRPKYPCVVVGRRFPVAHVRVRGQLLEVSSFATGATEQLPPDAAGLARAPRANVSTESRVVRGFRAVERFASSQHGLLGAR